MNPEDNDLNDLVFDKVELTLPKEDIPTEPVEDFPEVEMQVEDVEVAEYVPSDKMYSKLGIVQYDLDELKAWERSWHYQDRQGNDKRRVPENLRSELVDWLVRFGNRFVATNRLYMWNGYRFEIECEAPISNFVEFIYRNFRLAYKKAEAKEIMTLLMDRFRIDDMLINNHREYIPFTNGYYNLKTKTFVPPNPNLFYSYAFEVEYSDQADCPHFKQFVDGFIADEESRSRLLRFLAYCLTPSLDVQKSLLLVGTDQGMNGKSILFDIIYEIWNKVYSQLSLQDFEANFRLVDLRGKLLNVGRDLPNSRLRDEGKFKEAVTDSQLFSDEKNHPTAKWRNTTKHMFGCNKIPLPPDGASDAFFRRWEIIECKATYKCVDDPDFDPKKHRAAMNGSELVAQIAEEIPGIINYLMSFLPTIQTLRKTDIASIKALWNMNSENILQFIQECCDLEIEAEIRTESFYKIYKEWCLLRKVYILPTKKIGSVFKDMGIMNQQRTFDGRREHVYVGIDISQAKCLKVGINTKSHLPQPVTTPLSGPYYTMAPPPPPNFVLPDENEIDRLLEEVNAKQHYI